MTPDTRPFAVYLHWPFCLSKCPYCDFNSHVRERIDEAQWQAGLLTALDRQARFLGEFAPDRKQVDSIFFGGGTPSLMSPATVAAVLDRLGQHFSLAADIEITLEANPTSIEAGKFRDFRSAGINRVSVGIQALENSALKFLGRAHDADQAKAAIALAARSFERYSFDLIYARPGQTVSSWKQELGEALAMAGDHLSLYQLTIEAGTAFATAYQRGDFALPDDELAGELFETTQAMMAVHGLSAYEISNHAKPGGESRHNLVYWRYGESAGVGPGAHGRLLTAAGRMAQSTEKHPEKWLASVEAQGHGLIEDEALSVEAQGDEFLLMGLRLREGVDPLRFQEISGRALDPRRIEGLESHGLVARTAQGRLLVTAEGFPLLDSVIAELAS